MFIHYQTHKYTCQVKYKLLKSCWMLESTKEIKINKSLKLSKNIHLQASRDLLTHDYKWENHRGCKASERIPGEKDRSIFSASYNLQLGKLISEGEFLFLSNYLSP